MAKHFPIKLGELTSASRSKTQSTFASNRAKSSTCATHDFNNAAQTVQTQCLQRFNESTYPTFSNTDPAQVNFFTGATQSAIKEMMKRLGSSGIKNQHVLTEMAKVPRHLYLDEGLRSHAYSDNALPIGFSQTISQPYIVARKIELMLQHAQQTSKPLGRVLEIGTGCGYQTHVLSLLADEVFSIERIAGLHVQAKKNLQKFRVSNVRLVLGDGYVGLAKSVEPVLFNNIILAAACETVPDALKQQMAIGGVLIAPVYTHPALSKKASDTSKIDLGEQTRNKNSQPPQVLQRWIRCDKCNWIFDNIEPCLFVPMLAGIQRHV